MRYTVTHYEQGGQNHYGSNRTNQKQVATKGPRRLLFEAWATTQLCAGRAGREHSAQDQRPTPTQVDRCI